MTHPAGIAPARRERIPYRPVHGVLLLDKPRGLSSNHALQAARRLLRAEKAGHTGTLDPLASGLLPLCFGAATKYAQASLDADKRYTATLRLGETTASGDAETPVLQHRPVALTEAQLRQACAGFLGRIAQRPPMHSALKHEGRALYDYARAGVEVERPAREVTIHRLDILQHDGAMLVLDVACSKGTYIRSLAQDLGEALGCGAHLADLRRTGSGALRVEQALSLDALAELSEPERLERLLSPDELLAACPEVELPAPEAERFLTGLPRRLDPALADADCVRVYGPLNAFLGTARLHEGTLTAQRLCHPDEVRALQALRPLADLPPPPIPALSRAVP